MVRVQLLGLTWLDNFWNINFWFIFIYLYLAKKIARTMAELTKLFAFPTECYISHLLILFKVMQALHTKGRTLTLVPKLTHHGWLCLRNWKYRPTFPQKESKVHKRCIKTHKVICKRVVLTNTSKVTHVTTKVTWYTMSWIGKNAKYRSILLVWVLWVDITFAQQDHF